MKTTLFAMTVVLLSCPLLSGQAQPSTPKPESPWVPQFVSAEWVKVIREDVGGLSIIRNDDSGTLFLKISVKFKYKETLSASGREVPLPPSVSVKKEGTDIVWRWRTVGPDTPSQNSLDCIQLLTTTDRLISEQLRQIYSPTECAETSAGGFSFYFSGDDTWIPEKPETVKSLALVFGSGTFSPDNASSTPIPLNPKISYKTPEKE